MRQALGHPEVFSRETGALEMQVEADTESEAWIWEIYCDPTLPLSLCDLGKKCCILPRTENGGKRIIFRQRQLERK